MPVPVHESRWCPGPNLDALLDDLEPQCDLWLAQRADAAGAGVEALRLAVQVCSCLLNVRAKDPICSLLGVADVVSE